MKSLKQKQKEVVALLERAKISRVYKALGHTKSGNAPSNMSALVEHREYPTQKNYRKPVRAKASVNVTRETVSEHAGYAAKCNLQWKKGI